MSSSIQARTLQFSGATHAPLYENIPCFENQSVMIVVVTTLEGDHGVEFL